MVEGQANMSTLESPPQWYINYAARVTLQGGDASLSSKSDSEEPSNVYSFEAGRSWRAIRQVRKRGWL
jgi:hypothetical protein